VDWLEVLEPEASALTPVEELVNGSGGGQAGALVLVGGCEARNQALAGVFTGTGSRAEENLVAGAG
jgi:hypothetical protein